ncbi:Protein phosphatase 2C 2 [Peltigera leucophlebia]|nr:Protein phosphatase 2C 2 [Peltigera leucophlebia]
MGVHMSTPMLSKDSHDGHDQGLAFGKSSMQGWRMSMEDASIAILDLQPDGRSKQPEPSSLEDRVSFFGVYDGYGGANVSMYAAGNTHNILANQEAFGTGDFEQALKDSFLATDEAIWKAKYGHEDGGCAAIVGLITRDRIYVVSYSNWLAGTLLNAALPNPIQANAGNARAVLSVRGRVKPLSNKHIPANEGENARIMRAGGSVRDDRIDGYLKMSRALGHFKYKDKPELAPELQIITADLSVVTHQVVEDDEFLIIASYGLWDVMSGQSATYFVRRGIVAKQSLSTICENIMDHCLSKHSYGEESWGRDNMTVIIIAFLQGKGIEDWYRKIVDRVANGDGLCASPKFGETLSAIVSYLITSIETLLLAKILGPELRKYWSNEWVLVLLNTADESKDKVKGMDIKSKHARKLSLQDKLAGWTFAGEKNEPTNLDISPSIP